MVTGSLDSECVQLQSTLDCKKKTSTSPNRREIPLIRNTGWGTTEKEERQMGRKREKEVGRMQCFLKKEDKSLTEVEHVETTGERCCHLSCRTSLYSSLCTFIGMKPVQ